MWWENISVYHITQELGSAHLRGLRRPGDPVEQLQCTPAQNQQKHQSTRLLFAAFCTAFTQLFSHSPCFWSGGLGKCSPPPQGTGGVATALRSSLCLSARACDTLWPRAMLTTSCIKASLKQFRVLLTYLPRIESQIEHN